jgi:hypothetical protein
VYRVATLGGDNDGPKCEVLLIVLCISCEVVECATVPTGDRKPIPLIELMSINRAKNGSVKRGTQPKLATDGIENVGVSFAFGCPSRGSA